VEIGICIVIILVLAVAGIPIAISLFAGSLAYTFLSPDMSIITAAHMTFDALDKWTFLAIPLFIFAGTLLANSGASQKLIDFVDIFVGRIKGGLNFVVAGASMLFGAMSGSGPATAVAIGSVMLNPMEEKGYDKSESGALVAAVGTIGNLIPPSIGLIIVGSLAEVSIAHLFLGGVIPGMVIGILHGTLATLICRRKGVAPARGPLSGRESANRVVAAIPALLTPGIILGGIYSGVFTPTEAAAVACMWAFICTFIYRNCKLSMFQETLYTSVRIVTALFLIIGSAVLFSKTLIYQGIPQLLIGFIGESGLGPTMFLALCWALWIILGCFIDAAPITILSVPLLYPPALKLGIDPIFFGVFMQAVIIAGQETPPFGINIFVISSLVDVPIEKMSKSVLPHAALEFAFLFVLILFPGIVTWLPSLY
jgi:C4-dicarboxylate transporter DctM subunit